MKIRKIIPACTFALLAVLGLAACNDKIDVKQNYDFSLSCWHLPAEITPGERVEIRFTLTRQGDFKGAEYRIGYIQLEGDGQVADRTERPLVSREMYELQTVSGLDAGDPYRQVFTLYYTAASDERSELRFVVEDNFGRERKLEVSFDCERQ